MKKLSIITFILILILATLDYKLFQNLEKKQNELKSWVTHTHMVINTSNQFIKSLVDAETGQRGYLLTSEESYLEPYFKGINDSLYHLKNLQNLTSDNQNQQKRLKEIKSLVRDKFAELKLTIDLSKKDIKESLSVVKNDSGKILMDKIRVIIDDFIATEEILLKQRQNEEQLHTVKYNQLIIILLIFELLIIFLVFYLFTQKHSSLQQELANELESNLEESLQRFEDVSKNISDWIWEVDEHGKYTYVSEKVKEFLGYEPHEILGHTPFETMSKDEAQRVGEIFAKYVKEQKPFRDLQNINLHKDGHSVILQTSGFPIFDKNGKFIGYRGTDKDVTEIKQQEIQLEKSLEIIKKNNIFTNAILNNSGHAIITTDATGIITLFNKQAENLLGYRSSELVGKLSPAVFHKESQVIQRALQFSKEFGVKINPGFEVFIAKTEFGVENNDEWIYISKDKKEFTVSLFITKLTDTDGKLLGYLGMAEDISEKKEAQNKISHAKKSLDEAQKISHIGSWTLDLRSNHLTWSDEIFNIFEIDKEKFEPSYEGFLNSIHPDDLEMVNEAFSRSVEDHEPYKVEHRLKMKDGTVKYVIENGFTKYDEDDTPIFSQGTVQDVTESKRIERRSLRYLDLIDQNIITSTTNLSGKIIEVSQAFCDISGYTKLELLGQNHNMVRHPDMPKEIYDDLWSTIKSNHVWQGEIKNRKKDGSHYWVQATISPVFNDNGKKVAYTAIRQDITDKKLIEEISITDGLTNIYNRRHFNELFPKIINSSKRENELVSFLIMDIDHFKQYNDTYGHQMGDDVLIDVAACIKNSLQRADDYCFRLGGEEFGVIFKIDTKEKALEFANTIRQNIENLHIKHSRNSASSYVTASMGLICKNALEIPNDDEVFKQGDDLLYKAKESGRNQVCI